MLDFVEAFLRLQQDRISSFMGSTIWNVAVPPATSTRTAAACPEPAQKPAANAAVLKRV